MSRRQTAGFRIGDEELRGVEEDGIAAGQLLESSEPEADPGGTADLGVHERLLDSVLLGILGSFLLVRLLSKLIKALAQLIRLVEFLHHSEQFLLLTLLLKIDGALIAEACHDKEHLDHNDDERQGPNDAEERVDVEVIIGVS